eukprot:CAMPEP_0174385892 /NCGR_PEP_ID=MMETSP0811_2-20130205/126911_1 /TAXON_ID=73025 ORGANISM="Eutreptiella gymnastica-like, Strain CCMP1594" /NCGR_SAMPLE_ID=MMETSP0811_2 /ASSEMBLY_ACC=CAM_ASM_000667 /LENGTH=58 /DNA_ID=CAMNT_0015540373 /DNA_START=931 /DNA_END=1107 /DNA_ORIENTATION=-
MVLTEHMLVARPNSGKGRVTTVSSARASLQQQCGDLSALAFAMGSPGVHATTPIRCAL